MKTQTLLQRERTALAADKRAWTESRLKHAQLEEQLQRELAALAADKRALTAGRLQQTQLDEQLQAELIGAKVSHLLHVLSR